MTLSLFCFSLFPLSSYLTKHDTWNTHLSLQSHRTKSCQMACELSLSQYLGEMYQSPALCDIWSSVIAPCPWGTDEWWRDGGMTFKDWQIEWQRFEYLIICSFFPPHSSKGVYTHGVILNESHSMLSSVFLNGIFVSDRDISKSWKILIYTTIYWLNPPFVMFIQHFCLPQQWLWIILILWLLLVNINTYNEFWLIWCVYICISCN